MDGWAGQALGVVLGSAGCAKGALAGFTLFMDGRWLDVVDGTQLQSRAAAAAA